MRSQGTDAIWSIAAKFRVKGRGLVETNFCLLTRLDQQGADPVGAYAVAG